LETSNTGVPYSISGQALTVVSSFDLPPKNYHARRAGDAWLERKIEIAPSLRTQKPQTPQSFSG
jgi:hypothetical protein